MAHSDDIKEYAKELYVQTENGVKKYALRDIKKKIGQKYDKTVSINTISLWADENDWNKLLLKSIQHGIKTAHKTSEEINTELIEEQGKDIAILYSAAKKCLEIGLKNINALDEQNELSESTHVKLMEFGAKTIIALNDICQKIQIDASLKIAQDLTEIKIIQSGSGIDGNNGQTN
jgi:hypothetical protein